MLITIIYDRLCLRVKNAILIEHILTDVAVVFPKLSNDAIGAGSFFFSSYIVRYSLKFLKRDQIYYHLKLEYNLFQTCQWYKCKPIS